MNWTSILSQVFFGVLVTGATGSAMLLIWFLCRNVLQRYNPKLVYYMLRWVVITYLVPITYISFVTQYDVGYIKPMEGISKMLFVLNMDNFLFQGLAMLWLAVTIAVSVSFLGKEIGKYRVCRNNFDDGDSLAQIEFERIKEVLGIKGRVKLLRNDDARIVSPFVVGVFNRRVVVPYVEYTKEELDVIFYHELNHIKKHDILFRYLAMLAIVVNGMNPIAYLLWEHMLLWSEADCDAMALDSLEKEGISKGRYYDTIWKMMSSFSENPMFNYSPMLMSASESLKRRISIMEKYRANMKRVAKTVTFAWVMVFALFSSVTAHAAGLGLAKAGDEVLKETQSVEQDGVFEKVGWSDEMTIPASDTVEIIYINDDVMLLGQGTIDWDVPVGTRCVSGSIYLAKGTVVQIACTAIPSNCTYWFGLMHANSNCTVVEGTGSGAHDFTVSSSGYYRIMVENRSSQAISVTGGYSY